MSTKISALGTMAGGTVDRTADFLAIVDTSAVSTLKVTPNNLLGITGAPIGTTDSQTLSNKTLGVTNTVTLKDTLFTLQDDGDTSKQLQFQLSGITTATTRTLTVPDASGTLVTTAATQTLTNKTLTSPTITTPTINNPTLNTDAISEFTSSNGVTVAGVNIKSGALNTNNSVVTANITDTAVTPAKLQTGTGSGWGWQSWVPTYNASLTLGSGSTVVAKYIQTGKTVHFRLSITLGSSGSAIGTAPTFSLPVTANAFYGSPTDVPVGFARFIRGSAYPGYVHIHDTTNGKFTAHNAAGTYAAEADVTSAVPGTWANSDRIDATGTYEAA